MSSLQSATIASRIFEPEGGAAAYRLGALARSLEGAGIVTTVLTSRTPSRAPSSQQVRRWPVIRDRTGAVRGYVQYASFDIPLFFRLLFGPRADVVVVEPPPTTGVVARVACWLRRTPYVYFSADVSTTAAKGLGANRFVVACVRVLETWALKGAVGVLAVSEGVKHEVIELGADPDSVAVVGTGIDTEKFCLDGPQAAADYPYFVYAGTMSEMQGVGIFVEAFSQVADEHPDARLKLFGHGVEVGELRRMADRIGRGRVEFLGQVDSTELAPWFRGAHAGLASSRPGTGYDFAFATKGLVSLSCGTPVIYAGVGPLGDLVEKESLGWVSDWDVAKVAQNMRLALETRRTPEQCVSLALWVKEHYSLVAVSDSAVHAIQQQLS